ncbi:hypothetical protein POSPLADRAFT_1075781 [Postia placenta MAD-698-R-SB12]|uniref:Uncharacterized protein n=1 Tax=Postia placenta MAD-698-R-SB12 TaxID=670580 RepID=A0A1X6MRQ0_9APHY|nr:hypothetical protein POSPLADRAFT_1075781 [Postia placenta MAD-698-R-SB12]OSX58906.1 hypothetical protein POSPLADRAFT_1075781 [Postia placenta MAD-698-R-SB12]
MNTGVLRDVNGTVHRKNRTGIYAKQHDNATAPPLVVPHKRLPSVFLEGRTPVLNFERNPSTTPSLTTETTRVAPSISTPKATDALLSSPSRAPSRSLSPHTRRQLRYTRAQSALASTLTICSEPSPLDQQIRTLQRAAALLRAQAQEASEQVAKLRDALDRRQAGAQADVAPEEWTAMQCQRWMAERRGIAREEHMRTVQTVLAALLAAREEHPQLQAETAQHTNDASTRPSLRRHTDLACFFERSPTRLAFPSRVGRHTPVATTQRRKVISRVRSLRLRAHACQFGSPLKRAPADMDGPPDKSNSGASPPDSSEPAPTSPSSSRTTTSAMPVAPSTPCRAAKSGTLPSLPEHTPAHNHAGTAAILPPDTPRSRAQILASLDSDDAPIPQYAVALLDDLVASELDVTLALPAHKRTVRGRRPPGGPQPQAQTMAAAKSAPAMPATPSHSPVRVRASAFRHSANLSNAGEKVGAGAEAEARSRSRRQESSTSTTRGSVASQSSRDAPSPPRHGRAPSRLSVLSLAAGDFNMVSRVRNRLSVLGRRS